MIDMIEEAPAEVLDIAEIRDGKVLVKYGRTEAALAELKARYTGATYDLRTVAGDKAARAARMELVSTRAALEKRRKELKAPALEFGRQVDAEAERIKGELLALEGPIDAQIKADEERRAAEKAERERIEAERRAKHEAGIARIRAYLARAQEPGMTAERIGKGIDHLTALWFDPAVWEDYAERALQARDETVVAMAKLMEAAQAREAEAARLEAQRIENERVARELAEQRRAFEEREAEARRAEQDARRRTQEAIDAAKVAGLLLRPPSNPATLPDCASTPAIDTYLPPTPAAVPPPSDEAPTLKLGDIGARLGFVLGQQFIADTLGIHAAGRQKNAVLYHEADFARICDALAVHITTTKKEHAR